MKPETQIHLNRFQPRPYQIPVLDALANKKYKRVIGIWPRRAGKDIVAFNYMLRCAIQTIGVYFYIFPTYSQARKVIWDSITNDGKRFLDFIPAELLFRTNSTEMKITLTNGSIIQLIGSDNIDTIVGTNPRGCVFSEYALQDPRAYQFLRPALTANDGWALFISTPRGKNNFWELYQIAINNPNEWFAHKLTVEDTFHISLREIAKEKETGEMSDDLIQQEYYCFTPNTQILTPCGMKSICDIQTNELVISHTGRARRVLKTIERDYHGPMIEITSFGSSDSILCTPNHPIRIYNQKDQTYSWIEAQNVNNEHRVVFPKAYLGDYKTISYELCMLIAWYISDGSSFKNGLQFTINHEKYKRVSQLLESLKIPYAKYKKESVCNIVVNNVQLVEFFKHHCGSVANNKKIPFTLIGGYEKEFFYELMKGDGCFSVHNGHEKYSFTTVSQSLAYQVQLLAHSIGENFAAGITKRKGTSITFPHGKTYDTQESYSVQIIASKSKNSWLIRAKHGIAAKIKEIKTIQYAGKVHNIHVQYDESYVAYGRSVHNCSFDQGIEGSYYGKYLDQMRVKQQIGIVPHEPSFKVHTAWDLGVRDSTSIIMFQNIGAIVRIIDYYENSKQGLEHYVKILEQKPYTWGKHIAPHDIAVREFGTGMTRLEKARQLGIKFIVAPNLSVEDGIESVRSSLPKIWIDEKKCAPLVKAIENYRQEYDAKKRVYKSCPLHDNYSHACFIGETLIKTKNGNKKIKDMVIGDYVETPFGLRKVLAIHERLDTLTHLIRVGKTIIESTKDHMFFSDNGLVRSDSIRYNDTLEYNSNISRYLWKKIYTYCLKELGIKGFKKNFLSLKMETRRYLMDIFLDGITSIMFQQKQRSIHAQTCIVMFGRTIMAIYQKIIMFIIPMEIVETMTYQICGAFQEKNINQNIVSIQQVGPNQKSVKNYFKNLMEWLRPGTQVKKELNGIKNTQNNHFQFLREKNTPKHVIVASKNFWDLLHINDFVLMHVKQKIELLIKKTSFIGLVVCAKLYSFVINTLLRKHAVKNVQVKQHLKPVKVYDLTIETDNCYYANGYLVSNCDALRYLCISLPKTRDGLTPEELDKRYQEAMLGPAAGMPAFFRNDNNY